MNIVASSIHALEDYNFEIIGQYQVEGGHYVHLRECILFLNSDQNTLSIAYSLDTPPEIVAKIILILNEIEQLKEIYIMESYYVSEQGVVFQGESARIQYEKEVAERYLQKESLFKNMRCFNC